MSCAISVRLPDDLARQLDLTAVETGRSRSHIIREAVESYCEDYGDLQIASDRLHDRTDLVITAKEVRKKLVL